MPSNHAAARHLKAADEAMQRTPRHCTGLCEEAGVYNFYLRTPQPAPREADDRGPAREPQQLPDKCSIDTVGPLRRRKPQQDLPKTAGRVVGRG